MIAAKDKRADKARDFLVKILGLMGIEAEVETEEVEDYILVEVHGADLGILIGAHGRTLNALQDIVNLAANRGEAEWRKILVDVEGYREQRRRKLEEYAQRMAQRVAAEKTRLALEPMNSFERRIVHLALADNEEVETASEGEEPFRRVVISPKSQEKLIPSD